MRRAAWAAGAQQRLLVARPAAAVEPSARAAPSAAAARPAVAALPEPGEQPPAAAPWAAAARPAAAALPELGEREPKMRVLWPSSPRPSRPIRRASPRP